MAYSDEELRLLRKLRDVVRYVSLYKERVALRGASDRELCEVLRRKARENLRGLLRSAVSFVLFAFAIATEWWGVVFITACMSFVVALAALDYRKKSALIRRVERVLEREAQVAPPSSG